MAAASARGRRRARCDSGASMATGAGVGDDAADERPVRRGRDDLVAGMSTAPPPPPAPGSHDVICRLSAVAQRARCRGATCRRARSRAPTRRRAPVTPIRRQWRPAPPAPTGRRQVGVAEVERHAVVAVLAEAPLQARKDALAQRARRTTTDRARAASGARVELLHDHELDAAVLGAADETRLSARGRSAPSPARDERRPSPRTAASSSWSCKSSSGPLMPRAPGLSSSARALRESIFRACRGASASTATTACRSTSATPTCRRPVGCRRRWSPLPPIGVTARPPASRRS